MNKTAKEVMTTDVIVAKEEDSVADVAKLLIEERIGGLPVVNSENKVVGIISETDIIKKEKYIEPPMFVNLLEGIIFLDDIRKMEDDIKKVAAYKVEDLMSKDIVMVNINDSFDHVANIMIKKSINRVPVVDDDSKLKGIICRYDIIKALYNE
ncbi:CBS domain-containing protein [Metaclostridioides mangenotii]|uniref:CBS domain-containing protein n=1 Tax=Metaclostridioides mangenotii TaxID=1540 RepID=A0ABS4EEE7_9FIRM|nr:CBS domain-containing protein [Clostridioides mangenotii]MBP1856315.1 CBS domain-containing protein [Clostridioides mangenotii]